MVEDGYLMTSKSCSVQQGELHDLRSDSEDCAQRGRFGSGPSTCLLCVMTRIPGVRVLAERSDLGHVILTGPLLKSVDRRSALSRMRGRIESAFSELTTLQFGVVAPVFRI